MNNQGLNPGHLPNSAYVQGYPPPNQPILNNPLQNNPGLIGYPPPNQPILNNPLQNNPGLIAYQNQPSLAFNNISPNKPLLNPHANVNPLNPQQNLHPAQQYVQNFNQQPRNLLPVQNNILNPYQNPNFTNPNQNVGKIHGGIGHNNGIQMNNIPMNNPPMNNPQMNNLYPNNINNPQGFRNPPNFNPLYSVPANIIGVGTQQPVITNPQINPHPAPLIHQNPSNASDMRWAYIDDAGKEVQYDPAICRLIEQSYLSGQTSVDINSSNGKNYRINFGRSPNQVLIGGNGASRKVRRLDGTAPILETSDAKWYWKDDDGQWKMYSNEACIQLENCFKSNQKITILQGSNVKGYLVDLSNPSDFHQLNEKTNYKRSIMRQSN